MRCFPVGFLFAGLILFGTGTTADADWPQILGSNRDGFASDPLPATLPDPLPKPLWEQSVGQGLAGVAVSGTEGNSAATVYLYHRPERTEAVTAYDAKTGQVRWNREFPSRYRSTINSDSGPRCVPVIAGDRLVIYSPEGTLRALDRADGKPLWEKDTHKLYDAREGYFGAGSTPLVTDDRIIVNVGSRDGAAVVAFSLKTGEELWKAYSDTASYSSPILIDGPQPTVVVITRLNVIGVDPATGKIRFETKFGKRGPTVNAANPVRIDGQHVFLTANYGIGSLLLSWKPNDDNEGSLTEVYREAGPLNSQYTTPLLHEGFLYGIAGRADFGPASIVCCEPLTGKVRWTEPIGYGTLIGFQPGESTETESKPSRMLVLTVDGEIVLFEPSPEEFRSRGRGRVGITNTQPLPAYSDGLLYVKNDRTLLCLPLIER